MAKYLLTICNSGTSEPAAGLAAPADYLVEWDHGPLAPDGRDHWEIDLQIAGSVGEWIKEASYPAFWAFLESALVGFATRPRATLRVKSKSDARRVAATIAYLGTNQLIRAREELRSRIAGAVDPKNRRLTGDIELHVDE